MKNFKWYEWAMLSLMVGLILVGAALSPWGRAFVQSEGAPAWIQAIFSVVAILAGAGFVLWQHVLQTKRDARHRIEDRVERFEPMCGLIGQALWQVSFIQDAVLKAIPACDLLETDVMIDDVTSLLAAMDRVNVHELPSGYLCSYFIDVCRILRKMDVHLRQAAIYWRKDHKTTLWAYELRSAGTAKVAVTNILRIFNAALEAIERGERPELPI